MKNIQFIISAKFIIAMSSALIHSFIYDDDNIASRIEKFFCHYIRLSLRAENIMREIRCHLLSINSRGLN